ncbi:MAG: translocation/assembly module TamB domain-containing protein, partial [Georgfuchsia sp.]
TITIVGNGTLGTPQLGGSLAAANLGIEAPQYGVRLHDGTLRAELDDKVLTLREFSIHGDEGTLSATGTMARAASGEAHLAWRAEHLRVLNRPDMRLKVDGSGTVALADKKLVVRGALTADEGRFEFDAPRAPTLADDIVVIGRPKAAPRSAMAASFQTRLLDLDMALDAGKRLHIVGAGLDTDLSGKINLKTNRSGVLEAHGVLSSVRGVYYAFGQRLQIDRGRLLFDGPIDNPALDIVAKRKGLAVEAGVEVTGTVRVPNVQLTSEPPVSDSEKLAWLTLGHGLEDATSADFALLQTAASALIGGGKSVPVTQRIANKIGLDELSLKGDGQAGSQVAAVGKRLSDRVYFEYQQGLATASALLRLSYALTRSLSLRLETGSTSGLGVYYTHSYD